MFKSVYSEAVGALPINGGAFQVLLNTTTKGVAAVAACLTLLSYIATGVVSGGDAIEYLAELVPSLPVELCTVALLGLFAGLTLLGVSESSRVALGMFVAHMITLVILIVMCIIKASQDGGDLLRQNFNEPLPDITSPDVAGVIAKGGVVTALFFGTASGFLGVSGFESAANYVEEQAPGVFYKALRNMWVAVLLLNPVISLLSLAVLPYSEIRANSSSVLATMAHAAGGQWLKTLVVIDAFVVLSGAVLTAYVGVTGLVRRMALDRCLPSFLLATNKWRGTNHWIIVLYWAIASSLYLALSGNIDTLSSVYTLSFLCVMALFAVGCMLLKWKRPALPRDVVSSWPNVMAACVLVCLGLVGNILRSPEAPQYFVLYFAGTGIVVLAMFQRARILTILLNSSRGCSRRALSGNNRVSRALQRSLQDAREGACVFFAKRADPVTLNKAILYVRDNEQVNRLIVVHVYDQEEHVPTDLPVLVHQLDIMYPKLRLDLMLVHGEFGPSVVHWLSSELSTPVNRFFIACPDSKFRHSFGELGGVRVITTPGRPIEPIPAAPLTVRDAEVVPRPADAMAASAHPSNLSLRSIDVDSSAALR